MKGCLKAYLVDGNTGKEFIYYFAVEDWWIMGTAKDRYEHFIKHYPNLYSRIPKAFIASYLGVSRETLSRLYKS